MESSFLDRFGTKERTGLGGRSRASMEPHGGSTSRQDVYHQRPVPHSHDELLLLGLAPTTHPLSTFRTSEVLGSVEPRAYMPVVPHRVARTLVFDEEDMDHRSTYGGPMDPHMRPWEHDTTTYNASPIRYNHTEALDVIPVRHHVLPELPGRHPVPAPDVRTHDARLYPRPQPSHPTRLEPLVLNQHKQPHKDRTSEQKHVPDNTASPYRPIPSVVKSVGSPAWRRDNANLPGAVYSRAIPAVVHHLLYGSPSLL